MLQALDTVGSWGLGGGWWRLQPGHKCPWEMSWESSVPGVSAATPSHATHGVMKRREEAGGWAWDRWAWGSVAPSSHSGERALAQGDSPQAAWEKGVNYG